RAGQGDDEDAARCREALEPINAFHGSRIRKLARRAEVSHRTRRAVTCVTVQQWLQPAFLLGKSRGFEAISSADPLNGHREMVSHRTFGDREARGDVGDGGAAGSG